MDIVACETLPQIPFHDLGRAGPLALLEAERARADALLEIGRQRYPATAVRLAEALSRRWLANSDNPYAAEIAEVARAMGGPGAAFLNVSYEWGCTSSLQDGHVGKNGEKAPPRFLRVLDWPFDGLGAHVVAARFDSPAGPWINLTWPGFAGVVQGLAPGRFAACFNQAPLPHGSGVFALDWLRERVKVWRNRGLPPAHLLRRAFETCPDYDSARALLSEAPLALPAIFVLCGVRPGESCVIERLSDRAFLREGPTVATNHWQNAPGEAFARGVVSQERAALMTERLADAGEDFAWLTPPILNATTRLALASEPASGRLAGYGIEAEAPATALLRLEDGWPVGSEGGRRRPQPSSEAASAP